MGVPFPLTERKVADNELDGNLSFREREGYAHEGIAANEDMYNALRFFWTAD